MDYNNFHIQIIFPFCKIQNYLYYRFDIDICKCAHNISNTISYFNLNEINGRFKVLNCDDDYSPLWFEDDEKAFYSLMILKSRIKKYISRGFKLIDFNMEKLEESIIKHKNLIKK